MPKNKDLNKEMIGGCCVCSDDRGWTENPLVYCDGEGCNVAVHQACYGIVTIPTTNWYCRKCETPDLDQVKCELCPSSIGALKPTDGRGWAHVVCALYIPEVSFGNVTTMEPIIINQIPQERFNKTCYICEEGGKGAIARVGACMQCNRSGCRQVFHVTCAQAQGLLCEEAGNYQDNVKYCGYCHHHYNKLKKGSHVKTIPPYRPVSSGDEVHDEEPKQTTNKHSSGSLNKTGKNSSGSNSGSNNDATGDDSNQLPNGDSPELIKASQTTTNNKKRKSNRSSTPVVHNETSSSLPVPPPSESPRPLTPSANSSVLRPNSPSLQAYSNTNGGSVSKVGSIVVQVPLEAAGVSNTPSPCQSPLQTVPTPAISPSISDSSSSHHAPSKRSRSESSDKGEKRRSKRSSSGLPRPHRRSSPSRFKHYNIVKSSPEPSIGVMLSGSASTKLTNSGVTISLSVSSGTSSSNPPIVKEEKDIKFYENGVGAAHMLGNQLAPGSSMADTLNQEVAAHSIYTKPVASSHVGPHFPRPTPYRGPGSNAGLGPWGSSGSNMPQTLEQLLERQWEQGSQFLMEQAHHFDIASLLSCLHQLKAENAQLEEHVNSLQARRDNLLAVNARLAIPLVVPHHGSGGNNVGAGGGRTSGNSTPASTAVSSVTTATIASAVLTNASGGSTVTAAIVENGIPSPHEQYRLTSLHSRTENHRSGNSTGSSFSPNTTTSQTNSTHLNTSSSSTLSNSAVNTSSSHNHSSTSSSLHGNSTVINPSGNPAHPTTGNPGNLTPSGQSSVVVRAVPSATPTSQTQPSSRSSSSSNYTSSTFTSSNSQGLRRNEDSHKPSTNS